MFGLHRLPVYCFCVVRDFYYHLYSLLPWTKPFNKYLKATLLDGTRINLIVSPNLISSFEVTTSSTVTDTLFAVEVSIPSYSDDTSSSLGNALPSQGNGAPLCGLPAPTDEPRPGLPTDIVAIDSDDKTFLFYIDGKNLLRYLESPDDTGSGDFSAKSVSISSDGNPVRVSSSTKQIAAIAWIGPDQSGTLKHEIRVYYVDENEILREACKTEQGAWYEGALGATGYEKHTMVKGSPISATIHYYEDGQWNLRVYGVKAGNTVNEHGVPQMSVFKFLYSELEAEGTLQGWSPSIISNEIKCY